jgi:putative transposase
MTREDFNVNKSFKNIKVYKEELDEFCDKYTFTYKMSHYLKNGDYILTL